MTAQSHPDLLEAIRRFAAGNLAARVPLPEAEGEAADLAGAFNQMAATIEARVAAADLKMASLVAQEINLSARSLEASMKRSLGEIERVLAELELRDMEERLCQITENISEVFWLSDVSKKHVIYVSPGYEKIWGRTCKSLLDDPHAWLDTIVPEDRERVLKVALTTQVSGQYDEVYRIARPDGAIRWIHDRAFPVVDEGGEVYRIAGLAEDVTERVEAEQNLDHARRRLQQVVAASPAVLYTLALEGERLRVTWVSENITRVVGYEPSGVLGARWWLDHLHPEDRNSAIAVQPVLFDTGSLVRQFRLRHRDGTYRVIRDELRLLRDESGAPLEVVGSWVDVTEQRNVETELERAREMDKRRERLAMMGELLAGVAHELNNPLAVVSGNAQLLEQALAAGPLAPRAQRIAEAAARCTRLVRNFLTLARQHPPERSVASLNTVAQEALELVAYALRVDGVEVGLALADDLPLLWADPHQLQQVVVNLLTNAHYALRQSAPPRRLTITTRHDPAGGCVSLEVADTGPGIAPEVQARIFEPFFTTKPAGEGTGLGLSICLGIVEAHGGAIRVESAPGSGATFVVELPVHRAVPTPADLTMATPAPLPPLSVLVVDDEPEIADVLADMLRLDGHAVETASNGVEALAKLRTARYDLVLADVRMPGLDGPGLWREVVRKWPDVARRFVFITGDILRPESREFLEGCGCPSIAKPFAVEDLLDAIRRALHPPSQ